uniref:G2/mitotic-specific cyclin-B3 n=1 Tax=Caenorhabditis tropicalis TaxID=1561998 RepID=A0A1I7UIU9_9PELO
MRAALSLKPSNANSTANDVTNNKVTSSKTSTTTATTVKNVPLGKLTRQTGTSNLHREKILVKKPDEPLIKIDSKENFEVYEDPVEDVNKEEEETKNVKEEQKSDEKEKSEDTNNLIDELERKMEEKVRKSRTKKKKFMLTRDNSDNMSRCSEPPSEFSVFNDDDDFDKLSVASSTFTTTVRASFSSINVNSETVNVVEKKKTVIRKKVEKESRDESMFSSDEYFDDILKYMMHRQTQIRPSATYFTRQPQLNEEMRMILIDWFNDVVKEYRLQKETFHLAVKLVDRVLSFLNVGKAQFQLVGTTALMIAAKYEEIFPPEIVEFAVITDNTYRLSEILSMERFILGKFQFVIATPTAAWFGACFAKRMRFTPKMIKALNYLLDLSLIEVHFLEYRPSDIAAAAVCFTNMQFDLEAWPATMEEDTGIKTKDLASPIKNLYRMHTTASSSEYKSIFNKYCEMEEREVALSPAPEEKLREMFPNNFKIARKTPE